MWKLIALERLRPMEQAFYYLSFILSEKFFTHEEILEASARKYKKKTELL